ncbi:radical SAM protein [bacterium]|nr:radical SAM protein [bacterium]NIN92558.1 radical SAM protein [bacterium]NIO18600.1 radical SAM protein [bacterium]NIO73615.1 radical SAM protein [bacterium]
MSKTDVILIAPPSRAKSPRPSLGLMYLASYLEREGITADIIDIKGYGDEEISNKIIERIKKTSPIMVGITCLSTEVEEAITISKEIKNEIDCYVVVGGIHPTVSPQDFLGNASPIDFVVIGEGEVTLAELLKAVKNKRDLWNVSGIAWFNGDQIVRTESRLPINNLDELPFPAFNKVPMNYYTSPNIYAVRGILLSAFFIFTSRGCPFRCKFCSNKSVFGRKVRQRSAKNVVDEIEFLANNYGIDGFYIYDDTFTINKRHVLNICEELRSRRLDLVWGCETRTDLISEDLIKEMRQAGCIQIDFGVESGSQRILDILRKDMTVSQIRNGFNICRKHNMRRFANFMVNTPGETEEDIQQTINLARQLNATLNIFNVTTPFPGTDLYKEIQTELSPRDYSKLSSKVSFKEFINFIESKCKFSQHDIKLNALLMDLWKEFPNVHDLSFRLNKNYLKGIIKELLFIMDIRYLKVISKSKRKKEYVEWLVNTMLNKKK